MWEILESLPQLTEEQKSLAYSITIQEIEKGIDELRNPKAPGPDGLRAEFYKKFKCVVFEVLFQVVCTAYKRK